MNHGDGSMKAATGEKTYIATDRYGVEQGSQAEFKGSIDEVYIYRRLVSDTEIWNRYSENINQIRCTDYS